MKRIVPILAVLSLMLSCQPEPKSDLNRDEQLRAQLAFKSPARSIDYFILPESNDFSSIPQDPKNPLSSAKVELGKFLFHESFLGQNALIPEGLSTYSCASCHHAAGGFQAGRIQGLGEGGLGFGMAGEGRFANPNYPVDSIDMQPIKSPSILNGAYQKLMLWNGQFGAVGENLGTESKWIEGTPIAKNKLGFHGLETQAIAGLDVHRLECREDMVVGTPYEPLFDAAFPNEAVPDRYSKVNAGLAIAAYERTVLANQSPFQKWLKGEDNAMTNLQKEGMNLFFGKAACDACHTGPALNSESFHALGMDDLEGPGVIGPAPNRNTRLGRGGFTGDKNEDYKFKTPQLYSLAYNPVLGHGGSFSSVREILEYKNKAQKENLMVPDQQLAEGFTPLRLTDSEITALTAFVEEALKDEHLDRYEPNSLPSGSCIPNNDLQSRIDRSCN